jgi:hypothetical protein
MVERVEIEVGDFTHGNYKALFKFQGEDMQLIVSPSQWGLTDYSGDMDDYCCFLKGIYERLDKMISKYDNYASNFCKACEAGKWHLINYDPLEVPSMRNYLIAVNDIDEKHGVTIDELPEKSLEKGLDANYILEELAIIKKELIADVNERKEVLDNIEFFFSSDEMAYHEVEDSEGSLLKLQYEIQRCEFIIEMGESELNSVKSIVDKYFAFKAKRESDEEKRLRTPKSTETSDIPDLSDNKSETQTETQTETHDKD